MILQMDVMIEGEVYGGVITKGTRLISYRGNVIGKINKDLDAERARENGIDEKDVEFTA